MFFFNVNRISEQKRMKDFELVSSLLLLQESVEKFREYCSRALCASLAWHMMELT